MMKGDNNFSGHDRTLETVPSLVGTSLPHVDLPSTYGGTINFANLPNRNFFVFHPVALPLDVPIDNKLDAIFSIKLSMAILMAFNELQEELAVLGAGIFGVNIQSTHMQAIISDASGLKYPLLSDKNAGLGRALKIPLLSEGRTRRFPVLVIEAKMGLITRQICFQAASDSICEELRHSLFS